MEQVSRMAAEVNKLIGRNLLDGKSVHLPEVGSLYIVVNQEGVKKVDFSSAEQGASLIEIIKDRAGCTPEQSVAIFNRWISEVRKATTITIEGVGELRNKTFITKDSFSAKLNPQINTTKSMAKEKKTAKEVEAPKKAPEAPKTPAPATPKKSNKGVWIALAVILVAIGAFVAFDSINKSNKEKARIEAIAKEKAQERQRIADSIAVAQIEARRIAAAKAAEAAAAVSASYAVVYGVYELRSNVDVAIAKINKQFGEGSAREYSFGSYTMVTMFESEDRSECQSFLMANYDEYPDSWVHEANK